VIELRSVEQVRAAEEAEFRVVPEGALMQRAAHALAIRCTRLLDEVRGGVVGARIVLLVGSGNNGGDALWAGERLARRGCRVDALLVADRAHEQGLAALVAAGGRVHRGAAQQGTLLADADLVLDGILGIGGRGGLRPQAAEVVEQVAASGAIVVAVDVPSGVDADTGAVDGAAVDADVTVTFGAIKPGLLLAPGMFHSGAVDLVDIGLEFDDVPPAALVMEPVDVAVRVPEPVDGDYKYSRGVVGLAVGSAEYRGAAVLAVAAARHANVGMVRLLDRRDGVADMVVERFPDVVVDGTAPARQPRATSWACGSGFPGTADDEAVVLAVLDAQAPVVLDAGALTVVSVSDAVRRRLAERTREGHVTVLTPHDGEFERLRPGLLAAAAGRLEAARQAASDLDCIVVLKGAGTVIAGPSGPAFIDAEGTADLGVAGSGDVLTGILGSLLACADPDDAVATVAAGVWLHGCAGRLAAHRAPVTALDIADRVTDAVRTARFGVIT